jgi:exonuclease SbcC
MNIKKLTIQNIRSYENEEIIFPDGSLLLAGDVGSGKTSILLALEYALFGLQPGQKASSLLRNNADSGGVSLEFEILNKEIRVERRLKRSGSSISSEYSSLTIDGEKFELSTTETKTRMLSLLGYPQEFIKKMNLLYRYTVYTPQEQMKQIILEDPEIRLSIIRHIFGIDKYKRIKENLSSVVLRLKEDIKEMQGEVKDLDNSKSNLEKTKLRIKELSAQIAIQEKICSSAISNRKTIEKEFLALEEKLKERENLEKELDKTSLLISSKKDNLSIITSEINLLQKQILLFSASFNEKEYAQSMENLKILDKKIKELNQKSSDILAKEKALEELRKDLSERRDRFFDISICPTCLQNVPNSHKHNILNETEGKISDIRKQLIEIGSELSAIQNNLELGNNEREKLEKEKTRLEILRSKKEDVIQSQKRLEDYKKQSASLEKDILLLEKHFESLKKDISSYSKFVQSAKQKQDELKKAFLDEKNAEILFAEKRKELQLTENEEKNLSIIIADKEAIKSKLLNSLELNDWLSSQFSAFIDNLERSVLLKLRKEFSNIFNKWFHMLAGQSFEVQLDENFTPLIMSQNTEMDYQFLSGGERTAVALAYRLALNQTINSIMSQIRTKDIVILDEPTEGFSEAQIIKIREVLDELNAAQLIIVSHEQKIEGFVDNVIRLEKQDFSSIKSTTLKHKL